MVEIIEISIFSNIQPCCPDANHERKAKIVRADDASCYLMPGNNQSHYIYICNRVVAILSDANYRRHSDVQILCCTINAI